MKKVLIFFLPIVLFAGLACKKASTTGVDKVDSTQNITFDIQIFSQNLTHPWELLWGPDNFIWMTERGGKISRVNSDNGTVSLVYSIPDVKSMGEGGLLGMVFHPSFSTNPHVFVAYNYDKAGIYTEKVVRFTYNGTSLINPVIILDNIPASSIHNGCRLLISPDLKLFITTGDANNQASAQNINSLSGKILRINLDGSIPFDNPINSSPVWSFGLRNPQGLAFVNEYLFCSEHGPSTDDEINLILKNRNYGWPNVNGYCNENGERLFCNSNNVLEPFKSWTPTLAVSGMDFYNHEAIPQWKNSLILATLKDQTLYQLKFNSSFDKIEETKEIFKSTYGRLRDVCVSPDGRVFVATSNGTNDKIIVLKKK